MLFRSVVLTAPGNRFYFIKQLFEKNPNPDLYSIVEFSEKSFVVQFKMLEAGDALYYYSAGKLKVLSF